MFIECPHCKDFIKLEDEWAEDSACPTCGRALALVSQGESTTTKAEQPREIGKFQLLHRVGVGAFGAVWKARDLELGRTVAVKLLHPTLVAGQAESQRFYREARAAAQLRHPGIVTVHEVAELDGLPAIVSEFIEGVTLKDLLKLRRLDCREAAILVAQVADALDYAHSLRIVHRDVKPGNIMVSFGPGESLATSLDTADATVMSTTHSSRSLSISNQGPRALLLDFGLALREEGEATLTTEGQILGTPAYMSPEQAAGGGHRVDRRSDIYSLGVVLYEAIAGENPFRGSQTALLHQVINAEPRRPRTINKAVPRDLETICLKAMAKQRSSRYGTAGEVAADLRRFLLGDPILARSIGTVERLWRSCRRKPLVAALLATVLGLLLLVAVGAPVAAWRETRLRGQAEAREQDALAARAVATRLAESEQKLRQDAERLSLRLTLDRAWSLPEQGQIGEGMLWLVRALQSAPADDPDLRQAIRANLSAWYGSLHTLRAMLPPGTCSQVVAFSSDGRWLATANNKTLRLWDVATGVSLGDPLVHDATIQAAAFNAAGTELVTATIAPAVHTWRIAGAPSGGGLRCERLAPFTERSWMAGPITMALSPDGSRVAAACKDSRIRLWTLGTRFPLGDSLPLGASATVLAFSQDSSLVVTSDGSLVQIWEAATGRPFGTDLRNPARVHTVALSPDAQRLVAGGDDGGARIWDVRAGKTIGAILRHQERVDASSFSPDGKTVLTGAGDGTTRLWDAFTGQPIGNAFRHPTGISAARFAPDGMRILTTTWSGTGNLWQRARPQPDGEPLAHQEMVLAIAFSPDSRRLLTATTWGKHLQWDTETHQQIGEPLRTTERGATVAAYSPDGKRFLTAAPEGGQQWDAATLAPMGPALKHAWRIFDGAYSPDGSRIATGGGDNAACVWDAGNGKLLGRTAVHRNIIHAVAFHPSGSRIVTGSWDGKVQAWDTETLQAVGPLLQPGAQVFDVAFSPDGSQILTATGKGEAQLWDAATGQPIGKPMRHPVTIRRAAFSPDGRLIATGSHDGTARIWDRATGRRLGPVVEHASAVKAVKFSPDGARLGTADSEGNVWLWQAPRSAVSGDEETIKVWVETITGLELQEDGSASPLEFAAWQVRHRKLAELGGVGFPFER